MDKKETSEIAKLTERIAKDPKSKLFVPLAEEYKKQGDLEMAVHVLTEGLKNNPGYITARSFLGKLLYDRNDLTGAQKEFEDVVKAIPDNLMAQRKLADTYILMSRTKDALGHYQSALALNPKDGELAAMIADLEAGVDISGRVPKPAHPAPPPVQPAPTPPPAAQTRPTASPPPPQQTKAVPGAAPPSPPSPPAQAVVSPMTELEIAEEVLEVEPLEPEGGTGPEAQSGLDFLAETSPAAFKAASSGGGAADSAPGLSESFPFPEALSPEAPESAEPGFDDVSFEPVTQEEEPKAADDFTTDTLAELYIAQGFYEKAIDIYERMVADKPASRLLQEKLRQVRGMAAQSGAPAEETGKKQEATPSDLFEESLSGEADAGRPGQPLVEVFGEYVPPRQGEYPASDAFQDDFQPQEYSPPRGADASVKKPPVRDEGFQPVEYAPPTPEAPSGERGAAKPLDSDFKPVEYVAPLESAPLPEIAATPMTKPAAAGRQETIERLESWLRNIMKEK